MLATPESVTEAPKSNEVKGYSCLLCRQRKVKCDQHDPCSNCVKASKECSFIAPVRGKRKRTKPPREGLHARLKRYEDLLRSYGAQLEPAGDEAEDSGSEADDGIGSQQQNVKYLSPDSRAQSMERSQDPYGLRDSEPILVTKGGATRYLDSGAWGRLGQDSFTSSELVDLAQHVDQPERENDPQLSIVDEQNGILLENNSTSMNLANLHIPISIFPAFQERFIDRIDPLMKILHLPTFWTSLANVIQNPHGISKSLEALVFAFYLVTISTYDDSMCVKLLGADFLTCFGQYRAAARQALIKAEFTSTSCIETLQAYAMFMVRCRSA